MASFPPKQAGDIKDEYSIYANNGRIFFFKFMFHMCILFGKLTAQRARKRLILWEVLIATFVTSGNFLQVPGTFCTSNTG